MVFLAAVNPIGVLILLAIVVVPVYLIYRYRKSSWTGVVMDKDTTHGTNDDGSPTTSYHLSIKKDGAATAHRHSVKGKVYNQFVIADKVEKKAGKVGLVKM